MNISAGRRSFSSFLIFAVITVLIGLGLLVYFLQPKEKGPEETARSYFRSQLIKERDPFRNIMERLILPKIKIEQIGKFIEGGKATLIYQVETPDLSNEVQGFLKILFSGKSQKETGILIANRLKEIFTQNKYTARKGTMIVKLSKIEGRWRVQNVETVTK